LSSVSEEARIAGARVLLASLRLLAPPIHPRVPGDGYVLSARLITLAGRDLVIRSA